MKTPDADRLREIEVTQAVLRANIAQSQNMIRSCEQLGRQRNSQTAKDAAVSEETPA